MSDETTAAPVPAVPTPARMAGKPKRRIPVPPILPPAPDTPAEDPQGSS
ncbi:hypothetical protein [Actinocorallia sp. A-T 12471]|nr:hypothetical protein [Actinocorallia sp. A-T 12471]MDX6738400.1 hypothetical protein [Actinocorallia sp. A-T 12471]